MPDRLPEDLADAVRAEVKHHNQKLRIQTYVLYGIAFIAVIVALFAADKALNAAGEADKLAQRNGDLIAQIQATGVRARAETCRFAISEQRQDREQVIANDTQLRSPEFAGFITALGITRERLHELNVIRFYVDEGNYLLPSYCPKQRLRAEVAPPGFEPPENLDQLRRTKYPRAYISYAIQRERAKARKRDRQTKRREHKDKVVPRAPDGQKSTESKRKSRNQFNDRSTSQPPQLKQPSIAPETEYEKQVQEITEQIQPPPTATVPVLPPLPEPPPTVTVPEVPEPEIP